jgi:hypothetical protein
MANGNPAPRILEPSRELLQLCIAEYQMLTTRNTSWITLQYAVYTLMAVYLGLVVQAWSAQSSLSHVTLIWLSAIILQILIWASLETGCEQYSNIIYMERDLRIRIEHLVGHRTFWGYEQYMSSSRTRGQDRWEWKWGIAILVGFYLACIFCAAIFYGSGYPWWPRQCIWALLNVLSAIVVTRKAIRMRALMVEMARISAANRSRGLQD